MKLRLGSALAGAWVLCAASNAFAQEGKLKLGVRLGYALPAGNVYGEQDFSQGHVDALKLSTLVSDQVPIGIDAGYMVTPHVMLGLYGQYGVNARTPTNCVDCTSHDLNLGLQAQYRFIPERFVDPWLGLGAGYEALTVSEGSQDWALSGWQILNLQGGLDFRTTHALTLGPFMSVAFDEYTRQSSHGDSGGVYPKAIHEWITFGLKGAFGI